MRMFTTLALALGLLLGAAPAGAVSISFIPASVGAAVGGQVELAVVVGELDKGNPLGSYDLDLSFDASRLAFDSFDFGELLGGTAASLQSAGAAAGIVDLAEVSLLLPSELAALQGENVVIGTLRFTVIAAGESQVGVGQAIVGDGEGRPLVVTSKGTARINSAVPEPGAFALFGLGALAVASASRRRRS